MPFRVLKRIELWREAKERAKAMRELTAENQLAVKLALEGEAKNLHFKGQHDSLLHCCSVG